MAALPRCPLMVWWRHSCGPTGDENEGGCGEASPRSGGGQVVGRRRVAGGRVEGERPRGIEEEAESRPGGDWG